MSNDPHLDDCGCCEGAPSARPPTNPPGLDEVAFRAGDYGLFLQRLLGTLPAPRPGDPRPGLSTRDSDDPSIAFLDAAAVVGDLLTFYNERIANETFLRTAIERQSVLELARSIGYEMKPGVAASAYLAFEMAAPDPAAPPTPGVPTTPSEVELDAGIQVMSVPESDEPPQIFETVETIRARPEWNALRPRQSRPQIVDIPALQVAPEQTFTIFLEGTTLNLKAGDVFLFVDTVEGEVVTFARPAHAVNVDEARKVTQVDFAATPAAAPAPPAKLKFSKPLFKGKVDLTKSTLGSLLGGASFKSTDLTAYLRVQGWDRRVVQAQVKVTRSALQPELGIFVMRARTGFFGNNAPRQETLPDSKNTKGDAYPDPWDGTSRRKIWTNSQGAPWSTLSLSSDAYLDRSLPELTADSWAVFDDAEAGGTRFRSYRITRTSHPSVADYAISAKVTGLNLSNPDGSELPSIVTLKEATDDHTLFARSATAYVQSEKLALAQMPIQEPVLPEQPLELNQLDLFLAVGQAVAFSGKRTDLDGVTSSEVLLIASIIHADGLTELTLVDATGAVGPKYSYQRGSVRINANVALASHGESVREVLGSGNASQANQHFTLKRPPLTYISSAADGGAASTLAVRVNNALWREIPSLYNAGPDDQVYTVRRNNSGASTVIFGDGEHGARLPTGANNVTARYRTGIGAIGEVKANTLIMLMTRLLGVRTVTNPLDAGGSAGPESRENAGEAAPAAVLTLDRVVSLHDFENYARTFAGVGKAQAIPIWRGGQYVVHLTVTSTTGAPLAGTPTLANLRDALNARRDPGPQVRLADYDPRPFTLAARLLRDPRYEFEMIQAAAAAALALCFDFRQRQLAQPVTAAEIIACLSDVTGVLAVDLDTLDYSVADAADDPAPDQPRSLLVAKAARWDEAAHAFLPAQLLYLDPLSAELSEIT
jgi:predicted phage baseplate assembly protein